MSTTAEKAIASAIVAIALTACGKSFDDLSQQDATHALGVCLAYHANEKHDDVDWHGIGSKPNVNRGEINNVIADWTTRWISASDKTAMLNDGKEGCKLAGLPY